MCQIAHLNRFKKYRSNTLILGRLESSETRRQEQELSAPTQGTKQNFIGQAVSLEATDLEPKALQWCNPLKVAVLMEQTLSAKAITSGLIKELE